LHDSLRLLLAGMVGVKAEIAEITEMEFQTKGDWSSLLRE
jgi:hypothetical protein